MDKGSLNPNAMTKQVWSADVSSARSEFEGGLWIARVGHSRSISEIRRRVKLQAPRLKPWPLFLLWTFGIASWLSAQSAPSTNHLTTTVLSELVQPAKRIPFKTVLHATTGHRLLDLDTNNPAHRELRAKILDAAALAGERARQAGLPAPRANEAGNQIEPFVRTALREVGLAADVPRNTAGRAQVTGYPDVEIGGPLPCYLELKTYNAATVNTTQRSFYYSPSTTPKVTRDALHLLLAYELEKVERDGKTVFVPGHWKLITLQDLEVDLKFEFNQSNRGLYGSTNNNLGEAAVK